MVYVLPVTDLPATTGYGEPVQKLCKFGDGERVVVSMLLSGAAVEDDQGEAGDKQKPAGKGRAQRELFAAGEDDDEVIDLVAETRPILVASARGYGFRAAPDLSVTTRAGRRFARVADGDELVSITPQGGNEVICLTKGGKGLRFKLDEVAELSGAGRGVILMRLDEDDRLLAALAPEKKTKLVALMESGGERELARDDFPAGHRGGKGVRVVKRGAVAGFAVPTE
jgi:DNA gyrase subunit A